MSRRRVHREMIESPSLKPQYSANPPELRKTRVLSTARSQVSLNAAILAGTYACSNIRHLKDEVLIKRGIVNTLLDRCFTLDPHEFKLAERVTTLGENISLAMGYKKIPNSSTTKKVTVRG